MRYHGAHPRVGGENTCQPMSGGRVRGSSPRGRGKLQGFLAVLSGQRLIPAWAGKTRGAEAADGGARAHPRVGGENEGLDVDVSVFRGSSPRGRGKHLPAHERRARARLIPAWAGKTRMPSTSTPRRAAHPRVGGENVFGELEANRLGGSSPRGRGKLPHCGAISVGWGLIPAWAGKTTSRRVTA